MQRTGGGVAPPEGILPRKRNLRLEFFLPIPRLPLTLAVGWLTCKRKGSFGQPSETAGQAMKTSAQGFDKLPDMEHCRARNRDYDYELVDCLIEHPLCEFALAFGYGYFCRHPRRKEIVERTKAALNGSEKTSASNAWTSQSDTQSTA